MLNIRYRQIRVRDTRTGHLVPVRVALWDLPGWMCCSRVAVVAAVVGVILKIKVDILAKVL